MSARAVILANSIFHRATLFGFLALNAIGLALGQVQPSPLPGEVVGPEASSPSRLLESAGGHLIPGPTQAPTFKASRTPTEFMRTPDGRVVPGPSVSSAPSLVTEHTEVPLVKLPDGRMIPGPRLSSGVVIKYESVTHTMFLMPDGRMVPMPVAPASAGSTAIQAAPMSIPLPILNRELSPQIRP